MPGRPFFAVTHKFRLCVFGDLRIVIRVVGDEQQLAGYLPGKFQFQALGLLLTALHIQVRVLRIVGIDDHVVFGELINRRDEQGIAVQEHRLITYLEQLAVGGVEGTTKYRAILPRTRWLKARHPGGIDTG